MTTERSCIFRSWKHGSCKRPYLGLTFEEDKCFVYACFIDDYHDDFLISTILCLYSLVYDVYFLLDLNICPPYSLFTV